MSIERDSEAVIREAERSVNSVWKTWRGNFPDRSSKEILAMVAFQFAKLFFRQSKTIDEQQKLFADFEAELDRLLELTADPSQDAAASREPGK